MEHLTDLELQRELAMTTRQIETMLDGFEIISGLTSLLNEDHVYLRSEDAAYQSLVKAASTKLGSVEPVHIAALPKTLGELSVEGFRTTIKEAGLRFWKAISEAAGKFATLIKTWFMRLIGRGGDQVSKNQEAVDQIIKFLDSHETVARELGITPGSKLTTEELSKLNSGEYMGLFLLLRDNYYPTRAELEREPFSHDGFKASSRLTTALGVLNAESGKGNIKNATEDMAERMADLVYDGHLNQIINYTNLLRSLGTKEEIAEFIDNRTNESVEFVKDFFTGTKIDQRPKVDVNQTFTTGPISGTARIDYSIEKPGYVYYVDSSLERISPKTPDLKAIDFETVMQVNKNCTNVYGYLQHAMGKTNRLVEQMEELGHSGGRSAHELEKRWLRLTTETNEKGVRTLIRDLKASVKASRAWIGHYSNLATIINEVTNANATLLDETRTSYMNIVAEKK